MTGTNFPSDFSSDRRVAASDDAAASSDGAASTGDNASDGARVPRDVCDYCGSEQLVWRKCKLVCLDCSQINKSCADL